MRGGWCFIRGGCTSMNEPVARNRLMEIGTDRLQVSARNVSPIVPRGSIAGRALVAIVAIMSFLGSLTTGAVLLVAASAAEWQSDVASEITVQVRPEPSRNLDRDTAAAAEIVRTQPGIGAPRVTRAARS